MAEYTLPDLDWDYAALEPHISGQINELHHTKHHATYVKGANTAVEKLEEARAKEDFAAILLHEKNLAFNLGADGLADKWPNTVALIRMGDYANAAKAMRNNRVWTGQVKGRAERLAKMMETGAAA